MLYYEANTPASQTDKAELIRNTQELSEAYDRNKSHKASGIERSQRKLT